MEKTNKKVYLNGLIDGLPIALVYFVVSFTFGITVVNYSIPWWYATLVSMTSLTSAGQFAGVSLIHELASYAMIGITVLFINLRYFLMGVSISQQLDYKANTFKRFIMGLFITDEIFALASTKGNKLKFAYFIGLSTTPYFGWALGTLTGGLVNSVLPTSLQAAMGIALYCMFISLVISPAMKSKPVFLTIGLAAAVSCLFYYVPYLNLVPSGIRIIISTIVAASVTAVIYPVNVDLDQYEYNPYKEKSGEELI